uniref:Serpentine receptor class gamma n=1 Tax=Caenorhabditis japonica TaxID=281687 RepID=A0A8R1EVB3_CAEJA
MFNEYECFNYYIANILVRLLILFTNCALTIDRLITFLFPLIPCSSLRGILLFMLSVSILVPGSSKLTDYWFQLAASIVFSFFLVDEPSANVQPNCFVRINRDIDELTDQLLFYFWVCLTCLLLNIFAWCSSCYSLRNKKFILRDQYSKRESLNCAIVLSIILLFQMIAIGFYSISIVFILKFYEFFDHIVMANLILWFYVSFKKMHIE